MVTDGLRAVEGGTIESGALLVASVEAIAALPAIPTRDWCAQAARAVGILVPGEVVAIGVVSLNIHAWIEELEAFGAARPGAPPSGQSVDDLSESPEPGDPLIESVICTYQALRTPGWPVRIPLRAEGEAVIIDDPGGTGARVLAAIAPISGSERRAVLMYALPGGPGVWMPRPSDAALISACLPALARRASRALGGGMTTHQNWLSRREQVVLEMLIAGLGVRDIAVRLRRSPHTVLDHIKALHRKLAASTRSQLVARALGAPRPTSLETLALIDPKPARKKVKRDRRAK